VVVVLLLLGVVSRLVGIVAVFAARIGISLWRIAS